jgi:hypothetical protein
MNEANRLAIELVSEIMKVCHFLEDASHRLEARY